MNVRLISATPDAEKHILYIARVSSNQKNTDTGLIGYLIKNKHWSPFEHAHMTVEIETSRAIAQQILRHRSFTFQEFSQRYATPSKYEQYGARRQAAINRQSSIDNLTEETKLWFLYAQRDIWEFAISRYAQAIEKGIAKECARFLLPLNTSTKIEMTGSLRSWIHYFDLRCDAHTQLEHRNIADMIRNLFISEFPIVGQFV